MISHLALRIPSPTKPGAFRLLLAMLVFVHHFSSFGFGPYAVYVFFVLSGFWVHTMWIGRYSRTRAPYLTYLISRLWRLAPVMMLISTITIPTLVAIGIPPVKVFATEPTHLALSSIFLVGYAWLSYLPIGSAWSLDVEMQFYILAPLLSGLLVRGLRWPLLIAAAAISALAAALFELPLLPKYLLFFMLGMAAAKMDWRPTRWFGLASASSVLLLLVWVTVSPWRGILWGGASPSPLYHWNASFNVATALLTVPFAIYTVRQPSNTTDRMFADLSYIIYLAHWAAMQWFFTLAGHPFEERLVVAGTCFVTVPLVSLVIWRFYDQPMNRARAAWVESRLVSAPIVSASHSEETQPPAIRYEPTGP